MNGKDKCRILKQIRKEIATVNDIPYVTENCQFQGDCKGTCPKCEADLRYLELELEKRRRKGLSVALAGMSLLSSVSLSGCQKIESILPSQKEQEGPIDTVGMEEYNPNEELSGAVIEEDAS